MGRLAQSYVVNLLRGGVVPVLVRVMTGCITDHNGGTQISSDTDATTCKRVAFARQHNGMGVGENAERNIELA